LQQLGIDHQGVSCAFHGILEQLPEGSHKAFCSEAVLPSGSNHWLPKQLAAKEVFAKRAELLVTTWLPSAEAGRSILCRALGAGPGSMPAPSQNGSKHVDNEKASARI